MALVAGGRALIRLAIRILRQVFVERRQLAPFGQVFPVRTAGRNKHGDQKQGDAENQQGAKNNQRMAMYFCMHI